jgi:uncharacterized membrane protein
MLTRTILVIAFLLHLGFAIFELFPWDPPYLLNRVIAKMNDENAEEPNVLSSDVDRKLVSIIVHNAGIYNLILAAGFLWAAFPTLFGSSLNEQSVNALRLFFFGAATAAGLFGLTLSYLTAIQAAVGLAGIVSLQRGSRNQAT